MSVQSPINASAIEHATNDENFLAGLRFIWLEITQKCNLTCTHCYADSSPLRSLHGTMTFEDWTRVIKEAATIGCKALQFIGGEPTLHPHLTRLIEYASSQGFEFVEVYTNGIGLTYKTINTFTDHKVRVACSFYSANAEVHDRITKRKGSFDKTVASIQRVLDAGLHIRVGMVEMDENRGDISEAQDFLRSLGVSEIREDQNRGVGRGTSIHNGHDHELSQLCGQCWKGQLCVTSNGDVYPCVFSRSFLVGDVKQHSITEILSAAPLEGFRTSQRDYTKPEMNAPMSCTPGCNPDACPPLQCDPVWGKCPPLQCSPDASPYYDD